MSTEEPSEDSEEVPTTVHFIDGSTAEYPLVVRQYTSRWLYALRGDSPANHCVFNAANVVRIEAQTVRQLDDGIAYCNFEWANNVEAITEQELWITNEEPNADDRS